MKNLLFITLFIFGFSIQNFGQTITVSGQILDKETNQAIHAVNITNQSTLIGTLADEDGEFEIHIQKGESILFTIPGYEDQLLKPSEKSQFLKIYLVSSFSGEQHNLEEILVSGTRVIANDPFSVSNMTKKQLLKKNVGQDMPILLNQLPNVVTTSDAGAGVGYTGIRVRGSDATRVNVTINGIPLNDSESQGTYWVDIPDLASSVSSIQLQRGVGTSTNGTGAFGASLNLLTDGYNDHAALTFNNSVGSFNTRKHTIGLQSGKIKENFSFQGRYSKINSDGYIDRASSDLSSYYFSGTYLNNKTLIKFLAFGGHETTYQSWNGIDSATMATNRTFNSAGAIYDENWSVVDYYDNEVDDYTQNHYQLHLNQQLTSELNGNLSFHYTKGFGYYEQFKQNKKVGDYGLSPTILGNDTISRTDLIRRKWLDNDFYGLTYTFNYSPTETINAIFGGSWNRYDGDHFGEVIWARNAGNSEIRDRYYDNNGLKDDLAFFAKANYEFKDNLNFFVDFQYRNIKYKTTDFIENDVDENLSFINPKAGVTYQFSNRSNIYYSFARANKEPNRSDYEYAVTPPKHEELNDHELGFRMYRSKFQLQSNLYYMKYKNQLVLTGAIDDVGNFIRTNIGESYRLGVELNVQYQILKNLSWNTNLSLSQNENIEFVQIDDDKIEKLGNTHISYSPDVVFGNTFSYQPIKDLELSFVTKYVGSQYLANNDAPESKLDAYMVSDFQFNWSFGKHKMFTLKGIVNNVFDATYSSNGYMWGTTAYYYPQAGRHYMLGLDFLLR